MPTIPILAWHGLGSQFSTAERYRELAEAGFTHNLSSWEDNRRLQEALDAAHAAGVQLFAHTPQLLSEPESFARQFMGHSALGGYSITDEPSADKFDELGQLVRRIQSIDARHPCYINLFPTYAAPGQQLMAASYEEYVELFIRKVPTPMISFDHYPIMTKSLRKDFYLNLEIVSRLSRQAGKPFWAFALATAHKPYPVPTLGHLRMQQFSNLAYGAQCLQYFTYVTPVSTVWDFHTGPLDPQGNRTHVCSLVRQVNQELCNVAGVFLGCEVLSVEHTGSAIPQGTRPYEAQPPTQSVTTGDGGAVVSLLARGERRFLVIVNRDYEKPMDLEVKWQAGARMSRLLKDGRTGNLSGDALAATCEPGDLCVLGW